MINAVGIWYRHHECLEKLLRSRHLHLTYLRRAWKITRMLNVVGMCYLRHRMLHTWLEDNKVQNMHASQIKFKNCIRISRTHVMCVHKKICSPAIFHLLWLPSSTWNEDKVCYQFCRKGCEWTFHSSWGACLCCGSRTAEESLLTRYVPKKTIVEFFEHLDIMLYRHKMLLSRGI